MDNGFWAVFLIGLLGGVHCFGMCGGIVSALTVHMPGKAATSQSSLIPFAYNAGRIFTYTLLGSVMGSIGSAGLLLNNLLPVELALYIFANLMLVLMGMYLVGYTSPLLPLERLGHGLWKRVQPVTQRFLPARTVWQALPLGMLWGFVPCGMVYSVLATALVTGSATSGGVLMLVFGLGTLPNLLLAGWAFKRMRDFTRHPFVRVAAGLLVLSFGVWGLYKAPELGGLLWQGVVCHT